MRCCLLQSVKRVIGVEIIENAVEDAKANAQLNGEFKRLVSVPLLFSWLNSDSNVISCSVGVTNAQFVCGKAEDIIVDVFKNMPRKTKIIGIMDPPRAGLRE